MEFFYDGQIRRYITQTIRVFSNFVVQYGDGSLHRIPVMYGDPDRQVANIINQNSLGNKINSVPRIAIYVSTFALDRDRLADSSFVGKLHMRERDMQIDNNVGSPTYGQMIYNQQQGRNYTIERLMPTPFKLTMKCDIWSSSTEQKLQIMEQILVLFNPSLEIQTTDNYIDWTSLSVLNLNDINWSSRQVPVGVDSPIEVATITLETPAWISPPVKVKRLGVTTKIVSSIWNNRGETNDNYIEGLAFDPIGPTTFFDSGITTISGTLANNNIEVYANEVILLNPSESLLPAEPTLDAVPQRQGIPLSWLPLLTSTPGKYVAGASSIYLTQPDGTLVVGTFAVNSLDETKLVVEWNPDTLVPNTGIDSNGVIEGYTGYNPSASNRPNSPGTVDAIVNPLTFNPRQSGVPATGARYLIVEDVGFAGAAANLITGAPVIPPTETVAWGYLLAKANDIVEWSGTEWRVIFAASQNTTTMVWQTNIYTGVQYKWDGVQWKKSFEGQYSPDLWKIVL